MAGYNIEAFFRYMSGVSGATAACRIAWWDFFGGKLFLAQRYRFDVFFQKVQRADPGLSTRYHS